MLHINGRNEVVLKIFVIFCTVILCVCSICLFFPVNGEQRIYSDIIRLHVIANSDSETDQQLKLQVRDLMIQEISDLTADCTNITDAKEILTDNMIYITEKVDNYIKASGFNYTSAVTLTKETYPTIEYTDEKGNPSFHLPGGGYNSLRILIGEAKGKNWWCVLFPPLCLSDSKIEDELAVAGYTNEQIRVFKNDTGNKYVIRFKILEAISNILKK